MQKNKKSSAGIEVKLAGKGQIQGQIAVKKLFFVAFQGQRVRNTDSLWNHKLLHKRIRKNKKYPYKGACSMYYWTRITQNIAREKQT